MNDNRRRNVAHLIGLSPLAIAVVADWGLWTT